MKKQALSRAAFRNFRDQANQQLTLEKFDICKNDRSLKFLAKKKKLSESLKTLLLTILFITLVLL